MLTLETLLQTQGGTLLTQAILVNALHNAKVIDKQQIVSLAREYSAELATYGETDADQMRSVIDTFIQMLSKDTPDTDPTKTRPDWLRAVLHGGWSKTPEAP